MRTRVDGGIPHVQSGEWALERTRRPVKLGLHAEEFTDAREAATRGTLGAGRADGGALEGRVLDGRSGPRGVRRARLSDPHKNGDRHLEGSEPVPV
jgi:hypothetical protein